MNRMLPYRKDFADVIQVKDFKTGKVILSYPDRSSLIIQVLLCGEIFQAVENQRNGSMRIWSALPRCEDGGGQP